MPQQQSVEREKEGLQQVWDAVIQPLQHVLLLNSIRASRFLRGKWTKILDIV
jgi:hypothetical protein